MSYVKKADRIESEEKAEIKEELKKEPVQPGEIVRNPTVLMSELDSTILDRVRSQPKTLDDVENIEVPKQAQGRHRLSPPEELKPYMARFVFCWIYKHKRAIDEACNQYHWVLTNRTYFPDLPDYLFSTSGGIEQGDMILAFRSHKVEEEMRKIPIQQSKEEIRKHIGAHEGDPGFYTPQSDEWEVGPDGKRKKVEIVGL